jgi:hypothetical protein
MRLSSGKSRAIRHDDEPLVAYDDRWSRRRGMASVSGCGAEVVV